MGKQKVAKGRLCSIHLYWPPPLRTIKGRNFLIAALMALNQHWGVLSSENPLKGSSRRNCWCLHWGTMCVAYPFFRTHLGSTPNCNELFFGVALVIVAVGRSGA